MAERAQGGLARQGLQQRPRQHDVAKFATSAIAPAAIEACGAAHAAIAPAQRQQGGGNYGKAAVKVFPIEPVEQGQQRLQGHRGADAGTAPFWPDPP